MWPWYLNHWHCKYTLTLNSFSFHKCSIFIHLGDLREYYLQKYKECSNYFINSFVLCNISNYGLVVSHSRNFRKYFESFIQFEVLVSQVCLSKAQYDWSTRVTAVETLAYLTEVDSKLQEVASISNHLIPTLANFLHAKPQAASAAESEHISCQLRAAAFMVSRVRWWTTYVFEGKSWKFTQLGIFMRLKDIFL